MPSIKEHNNQYKHNLEFVQSFHKTGTPYYDWVITVYFYVAVHLVEASLAEQGIHSRDHPERIRAVQNNLPSILSDYLQLYQNSRRARYEAWMPTFIDVDRLISNHFEPLKKHLVNKI